MSSNNEGSDEDENDFACVPLSNIDRDTMTFKKTDKFSRQSIRSNLIGTGSEVKMEGFQSNRGM